MGGDFNGLHRTRDQHVSMVKRINWCDANVLVLMDDGSREEVLFVSRRRAQKDMKGKRYLSLELGWFQWVEYGRQVRNGLAEEKWGQVRMGEFENRFKT